MKPSYRPRNKRRINKHGFRARMATRWGRARAAIRRTVTREKGRRSCWAEIVRYRVDQAALSMLMAPT